jgi:hypothetical protein
MSRRRVSSAKDLKILSTAVPKRDGLRRVEAALRLLLDPPMQSRPSTTLKRSECHETSAVCPRLDPSAGPRPDD